MHTCSNSSPWLENRICLYVFMYGGESLAFIKNQPLQSSETQAQKTPLPEKIWKKHYNFLIPLNFSVIWFQLHYYVGHSKLVKQ